ncbi:MAG: pectate lyase [bacterium]|nr:pectate lyase [bacterium]
MKSTAFDGRGSGRRGRIHRFFALVLLSGMAAAGLQAQPWDAAPGQAEAEEGARETVQSRLRDDLLNRPPAWYGTGEALRIADNMTVYQRKSGGWPKNIDMTRPLTESERRDLAEFPDQPLSTIDNGATVTQMIFLALVFGRSAEPRYALSFLKGLDYLLKAQYGNGGWPQYFPRRQGYFSHITFNDDAMTGVLRLLKRVSLDTSAYGFVDRGRRKKAAKAVEKGIGCILKTQVRVNGRLTAWCAQHDEHTLKPAAARRYELPSLSGSETVGIVRFLMEQEPPTREIAESVRAAAEWLDRSRIRGIRVVREPDASSPTGWNRVIVRDPEAPDLWARFYQIGTDRPFFSDRDGRMVFDLSEISSERRNRYGWLGDWPEELLAREFPAWREKWKALEEQ